MKQYAKHHINEETHLCVPTVLVVKKLLQGIWSFCVVYLAKLTSCSHCLCPEYVKVELWLLWSFEKKTVYCCAYRRLLFCSFIYCSGSI